VAFLDDLKRYLERPEPVFAPDVAAHRKHLVHSLGRLEQSGVLPEQVVRTYASLSDRLQGFTTMNGVLLQESFGKGEPVETLANFVNIALEREMGLHTSTGSQVKDFELDRVRRAVNEDMQSGRWWQIEKQYTDRAKVEQYALELRAVKRTGAQRVTTAIGKLILDLPRRDAIRWILAAEATQAQDVGDDWRLSCWAATALLEEPSGEYSILEDEDRSVPATWKTMKRLSALCLVSFYDTGRGTMGYEVLDEGRPLLQEIASGKDTPFTLLARALLQDETDAVIGEVRPSVVVQGEGSAAATSRHARMVAHEIRNALVPVQSALEALYRNAERQGMGAVVGQQQDAIDGGIARVFRFLRDISRIADLASTPSELFDLGPAVQAAIAAEVSEIGHAIPFEPAAALPAVRGNRARFELAVVNLLRNAAQARAGSPVTIRVVAGVKNGAEVFVAVDDDGPGVPPEHRASVFEPGFSLRPDGTGQGLALVREVVETEMAGRAVCEESPLGGARFIIRLPVGARRNG
jgi:signal transduction histidine kinase